MRPKQNQTVLSRWRNGMEAVRVVKGSCFDAGGGGPSVSDSRNGKDSIETCIPCKSVNLSKFQSQKSLRANEIKLRPPKLSLGQNQKKEEIKLNEQYQQLKSGKPKLNEQQNKPTKTKLERDWEILMEESYQFTPQISSNGQEHDEDCIFQANAFEGFSSIQVENILCFKEIDNFQSLFNSVKNSQKLCLKAQMAILRSYKVLEKFLTLQSEAKATD